MQNFTSLEKGMVLNCEFDHSYILSGAVVLGILDSNESVG